MKTSVFALETLVLTTLITPVTSKILGCFKDGLESDLWPVYTHFWAEEGAGVRLDNLPRPDATVCIAQCAERGYELAGLIWHGPDELTSAGYVQTQCYCAHELGVFERESWRRLADYQCCPTCLNYDLSPFPDPPCVPTLDACGAYMTMSVHSTGPEEDAPVLPAPPVDAPMLNNPCVDPGSPHANLPWCDASLPIDERLDDAIGRMTLKEKIAALLTGNQETGSAPIPSLGLNNYMWWQEASHGVATKAGHKTTNFALPLTVAQSFNRSLWRANGAQIGREGRALMNGGHAYSTFWAPVINLASEPRWGRNLETAGEDPFMSGQYAVQFVRGMQEAPEDDAHLMASACCKHYVANQMEHSTEAGVTHDRLDFNAEVTQPDLLDSYMPPFQACVEQGHVSGLMCSYNALNGVPTCADGWLMNTVARGEWGFDGYITTDCGAADGVFSQHHFSGSPEEAVRDVLRAGTDLDCDGELLGPHTESALAAGLIEEADIDTALRRSLRVRMRLANFDPPSGLATITEEDTVCTDYGRKLGREGARQASVLLKNDGGRLPLSPATAGTVAVVGPNANLSMMVAGYYGPANTCGNADGVLWPNMVHAVQNHAQRVVTAPGLPWCESDDTSGVAEAVALAAAADTVVAVLGSDLAFAREGVDATRVTLSTSQLDLVAAVAEAAAEPIVVVLLTSTPLDVSPLLANPKIGAIVHAGVPSAQTEGVGDVLFAADGAAPAGRLVQTVYDSSFTDSISVFDANLRPGPSKFPKPTCATTAGCPNGTNPGRTYRFYTGTPVLPFGYGLSYTSFSYMLVAGDEYAAARGLDPDAADGYSAHQTYFSYYFPETSAYFSAWLSPTDADPSYADPYASGSTRARALSLSPLAAALAATTAAGRTFPSEQSLAAAAEASELPTFRVRVTNTGDAESDEVVLGFLVPPNAGEDGTPLQSLFGFERVHLLPGESVVVELTPTLMDFSAVDAASGSYIARPGTYVAKFGVEATVAAGGAFVQSEAFEASLPPRPPPPPPTSVVTHDDDSVAGKSLYFVLIDRFARSERTGRADDTDGCTGQGWCGGDLRGILERLDYIQGMGFDCVWISPVVGQPPESEDLGPSGTGYHGYWAEDWYAIDRHYGSKEDLKELSAELHERGMCLVLDIVLNHVRPIHSAADVAKVSPFNDTAHYHALRKKPTETFDQYAGHPVQSLAAFGPMCGPGDYQCAGGYDEAGILQGWFYDLADLDQSHPYVRAELKRWTKHMVREYGLDALRLDTAAYVPLDFLAELQADAGVEIIGEVTAANLTYHASFTWPAAKGGGGLRGVLNFPAYYQMGHGFCGADSVQGALFEVAEADAPPKPADFHPLAKVLAAQQTAGYADLDLMGVFADNHDVDRLATICRSDVSRIAHSLAFVMMSRGVPIVYSGTEQMLTGDKENHNRYGLWADAGYDVDAPLYQQIRALNEVRHTHLNRRPGPALPSRVVSVSDETLVLARGDAMLLFLNNRPQSEHARPIRYCLGEREGRLLARGDGWYDALSGEGVAVGVGTACPKGLPYEYVALDGAPKAVVRGDGAVAAAAYAWRTGWDAWWASWRVLAAAAIGASLTAYWLSSRRAGGAGGRWARARSTAAAREKRGLKLAQMRPRDECWVLTDDDHRIQSASAAWCELWGYDEAEVVGRPISIINGPGTNAKAGQNLMARVLAGENGGGWATARCTNTAKSGQLHTHNLTLVKQPAGGWLAVSSDIKKDESQLDLTAYEARAQLAPQPPSDPAAWQLVEDDDDDDVGADVPLTSSGGAAAAQKGRGTARDLL